MGRVCSFSKPATFCANQPGLCPETDLFLTGKIASTDEFPIDGWKFAFFLAGSRLAPE
jgi:hypothetical protein